MPPNVGAAFRDELIATANALMTPGKGLLAADESISTIGKRFADIGLENTEGNRVRWRELLFSTPGLSQYVSGIIVYEETLLGTGSDGILLRDKIKNAGIVLGIKVDIGLSSIPGCCQNESATLGLDHLAERCKEFYRLGCRFAKWRAVYKITESTPSAACIEENAWGLARYGAICQENGLVPIIEPEILADGDHDIDRCASITETVQAAVYTALRTQGLILEGTLLKPNMVIPGNSWKGRVTSMDIAAYTIRTLQRTVPVAVPGIVFLSGGQSEEDATENLNCIASMQGKKPWAITFSFSRAMQHSCLQTWKGDDANREAAQRALLVRARANGDAQLGRHRCLRTGLCEWMRESLFVQDYKY